jgi:hypothetical protein
MTNELPEPEWFDDHLLTIHEGTVEICNPEKAQAYIDADADDMVYLASRR